VLFAEMAVLGLKLNIAAVALLGVWIKPIIAGYNCGEVIVYTGATPCTFCPAPTCTNKEVGTLSCSCATVTLPTFTFAADPCQSYGPCDTLSCATEIVTWTQPCPTQYTWTSPVGRDGCPTATSTVTNSPAAGCPSLNCPSQWCQEDVVATVACSCSTRVVPMVTTTVPCPTTCFSIPPCPFTSYSTAWTGAHC